MEADFFTDDDKKIIGASQLFQNFTIQEIEQLILALNAQKKSFLKDEYIFHAHKKNNGVIGIVLSGRVTVCKDDYWGRRSILVSLGQSELFAESFVLLQAPTLPVSLIANEDSSICLVEYENILKQGEYANRFVGNINRLLAKKNKHLTEKIEILTRPNASEKLLTYFSFFAQTQKNNIQADTLVFTIPFNRQELADYLSIDKSAISTELTKLKKRGLIDYDKNTFTLFNQKK